MKKAIILVLSLTFSTLGEAQQNKQTIRAALFVSLYLDSSFDKSGNYLLKNSFPKNAAAGLEFYEGASLAIDSINAKGTSVILETFDIKSKNGSLITLLGNKKFDSIDLIIGQLEGFEYLQIAKISKAKNIPLINATYPNDGGIRGSPTVFLANPKINSHIQVIFNQIEKKWPSENIIWCRRGSSYDEKIEGIFKDFNGSSNNGILKYKTLMLNGTFSNTDLANVIDTTKNNVFIAGSLDEDFCKKLITAVSSFDKKSKIQVIGMPSWESFKEIQHKNYAEIPIFYTSSFHIPVGHNWATTFDNRFKNAIGIKSTTTAYKAYELTFYFIKLMLKYGQITMFNLDDPQFKLMTDFDFKPIKYNPKEIKPDYFENKKIYFLRRLNGTLTVQ
jgi:ABC-type branched-subunit amino acid transport system substrate-binding protein